MNTWRASLAFGLLLLEASVGHAGVALFSRSTDTIGVSRNDVPLGASATYEARILFTAEASGFGRVYNEFRVDHEDKALFFGPNSNNPKNFSLAAYSAGLSHTSAPQTAELAYRGSIQLNQWHHIAYVYDGAEERLYLDGMLVNSRQASGQIWNHDGFPAIGSNFREREAGREAGFVGFMSTLRISAVARYAGTQFNVPLGDLPTDGNTQLLFNFNDPPQNTTIADEGVLHRVGTLGGGPGVLQTSPSILGGRLNFTAAGHLLGLEWPIFWRLQSARSLDTVVFTDIPGASSPYFIDTSVSASRYYRLRFFVE